MQVFPIKNNSTSFKGVLVNNRVWTNLKNDSHWHKNSTIETTIGAHHTNTTHAVYYADPMENVSDSIKKKVDYVVYDNEPSYPDVNKDISENYFGTRRKNYREDFEEIRDYYYRREMGGHADKAEAQYQQWQAAECIRMYDKAGDLRYRKEKTEDEIVELQKQIKRENEVNLPANQKALGEEQELERVLVNRLANLEEKNGKYSDLKSFVAKTPAQSSNEEKVFISSQLSKIKRNILQTQVELANCQEKIKIAKEYIQDFPKLIAGLNKQIDAKNAVINEFKAKLAPLFDELKNFYVKQGIRR